MEFIIPRSAAFSSLFIRALYKIVIRIKAATKKMLTCIKIKPKSKLFIFSPLLLYSFRFSQLFPPAFIFYTAWIMPLFLLPLKYIWRMEEEKAQPTAILLADLPEGAKKWRFLGEKEENEGLEFRKKLTAYLRRDED